jgi:hypothetical protein
MPQPERQRDVVELLRNLPFPHQGVTMLADREFNTAVRAICETTFPHGFDWASDAPNTFDDLAHVYSTTGRMVVTDAWHPADHPQFEDAYTYRAFRAWHDWTHILGACEFTLEGECRAAKIQHAQLAALYGEDKATRWFATLNDELIINNFGECAVCST